MPANLPPVYHEAEDRYRAAKQPAEKIAALEEMLRLIPKHKGTDKLQGEIKARIAKLKRQPKKQGATRAFSYNIPKEGAGQVALVGPPNSGKSSLLDRLTRAEPEIADYPFTTREPVPGMMPFEDIAIQLIDLPPLSEEFVEAWVYDAVRRADLLWIVVRLSSSIDGLDLAERLLAAKNIAIRPAGTEPAEELPLGGLEKPALLVVTGRDRPDSDEGMEILVGLLDRPWPLQFVSALDGSGLEKLRRATFDALEIIRVYTKQPGKPPDRDQPYTLPREATVAELARQIHKDLHAQFKFARVWGRNVFDGQTVQREHVLCEGDVIEIHN